MSGECSCPKGSPCPWSRTSTGGGTAERVGGVAEPTVECRERRSASALYCFGPHQLLEPRVGAEQLDSPLATEVSGWGYRDSRAACSGKM